MLSVRKFQSFQLSKDRKLSNEKHSIGSPLRASDKSYDNESDSSKQKKLINKTFFSAQSNKGEIDSPAGYSHGMDSEDNTSENKSGSDSWS